MFLFLDLVPTLPPLLLLHCQNMSNHGRIPCADSHCTNTYDTRRHMQEHYTAKHTEERFPCRYPGCKSHFSSDNPRITHERKTYQLYHCRRDACNQPIEGAQNWKLHQEKHRPYRCPEPGCDRGYTTVRSLHQHQQAVHTRNSQPCSNPLPPSRQIPVAPPAEPLLDEETKRPIPNGEKWWRFL